MTQAPPALTVRRVTKHDLYRYCRLVHGWLSAIAFLVLCFFSITGLLLNHPDWSSGAPQPVEHAFKLDAQELERVLSAEDPETLLSDIVANKVPVKGAFLNGNKVGNELFIRLQGVRGLTDIRGNLRTGEIKVVVESAPATSLLNELHRGERAGNTWRVFIDAFAILLVVLSIVGYLIFLSLRYRLRTALVLTIVSTIAMWAFFKIAVA